jgi:hypothetical protein
MSSDLTDGAASADPGVDQFFRILTAGPTPDELAGEQSALAMFRANVSPLASPGPASRATVPIPVSRPAAKPKRSLRHPFQGSARWGVRLAAAGVIAIGGGMTAAAYAAVLPAPVQHLAHVVLRFAGVPDAHHQHHAAAPGAHGTHAGAPAGHSSTSPGGPAHHSPAATPSRSAHASGSPSTSPSVSPSPSSSAATGPAVLSASASSADIMAGTAPVIDGQLTRSGTGVNGVTVTLIERLVGHPFWHIATTGQTTSAGNVAITGPPLAQNAVFQLRIPGGVHSASVLVTVTPQVDVVLTPGASGLRDLLSVSTQYAHRGNVVWLEVQSASGSWVNLRSKRLNAAGKTWFVLSGTRLKNKTVQVVLVATARHGAAVSNQETVPPPS